MSKVLIKKSVEDVIARLGSGDYRTQGKNRKISLYDETGLEYKPQSPELRRLWDEAQRAAKTNPDTPIPKVLRKFPRSHSWNSMLGAGPGGISESAISRALASMGYPIEPEYPVFHEEEDFENLGRGKIAPVYGAVEQRIANKLAQARHHGEGARDLTVDRLAWPLERHLQYGKHVQNNPNLNILDALGIVDNHADNVGQFDERTTPTPVSDRHRIPIVPSEIPHGKSLTPEGRDIALFDDKGKLRTKPLQDVMRTFDPMYTDMSARGKTGDLDELWQASSKYTDLSPSDWLATLDKIKRRNMRIPLSYDETKDHRDIDPDTGELLTEPMRVTGLTPEELAELGDHFDTRKMRQKVSDFMSRNADYLHPNVRGELSDFVQALPPESDYGVWAPEQREIENIMMPPSFDKLPAGYKDIELNPRGKNIKERLDRHRLELGKYKAFKNRLQMLNAIAEDPEQMRIWEFMNPNSAIIGHNLRMLANKKSADLSTEVDGVEDGDLVEGKNYFKPENHPLLTDAEGALDPITGRTVSTDPLSSSPSPSTKISDTLSSDGSFANPFNELRRRQRKRIGEEVHAELARRHRSPQTPSYEPEPLLVAPPDPKMVKLVGEHMASRIAGHKAGMGIETLDARDRPAEKEQEREGFGSLFNPSRQLRREREILLDRVISHNKGYFQMSAEEAGILVAGWDTDQRKLALNKDNLALDLLSEHEGMLPEWLGSDFPHAWDEVSSSVLGLRSVPPKTPNIPDMGNNTYQELGTPEVLTSGDYDIVW